jgi:hypothetical protein
VSNESDHGERLIVDSQGRTISQRAVEALQEARLRIGPAVAADRMWHQLFTDADRQRFDGDLESNWPTLGTIGMWMQARDVTLELAIIEVAHGLGFMDSQTVDWLRRDLGLTDEDPAPPSSLPEWCPDAGELRFQGRVIRRIRVLRAPSNIHRIVTVFQDAGWTRRVDNPLSQGQQQLHQAIRHLNEDLELIRFRVQEGGLAITWEQN